MGDLLITADELAAAQRGRGDGPTLLDVRWTLGGPPGLDAYRAGHLPEAVFVDLDRELSGPPGVGGRHPLPSADAFGVAMRRAGVSADRPVVVYAGSAPGPAARAWWVLRYFGHPDVRVLDGGIDAWVAVGGGLVTGDASAPTPGDFEPSAGGLPLLDAEGAARVAASGRLVDVRTPERFRGEHEPIDPVAGHIPGAENLPVGLTVDPDGRLASPATVHAALGGAAATGSEPIGAYCGSGVAAAHAVLALAHAGVPAALYVGSWSEWITNPQRPIARDG